MSYVQSVSPTWFSHGPLTTLGRLYGWGDSLINPPGAGPQSLLFHRVIFGCRAQHTLFSCTESISNHLVLVLVLPPCCNLDGVEVSISQLLCRSSAPLPTSWMLSMRGYQSNVPRSVVQSLTPVAVPLPEVPAQPSPFSGAVTGVPDRFDQRPQSPSTNAAVMHSAPAVPPQPSPFSRSASSAPGSNLFVAVPQSVPAVPVPPTSIPQSSSGGVPDGVVLRLLVLVHPQGAILKRSQCG